MDKQELLNHLEDMYETYQYLHTKANLTWDTLSDDPNRELNPFEIEKILDLMNSIKIKHAEIDASADSIRTHLIGE